MVEYCTLNNEEKRGCEGQHFHMEARKKKYNTVQCTLVDKDQSQMFTLAPAVRKLQVASGSSKQ